jgi:coenzyme F420-reducing hydrogenase gamma subunit
MSKNGKIKLAVWKFASCDGCQLSLLNLENQLPDLARRVQMAYFLEGFRTVRKGPYDLSLVEGSITTPKDKERIHHVRRVSRTVIAIGACAVSGGIQALRNFHNIKKLMDSVYPNAEDIETLARSTPLSDHIRVDYEVRGCPISQDQLLWLICGYLIGRKPSLPGYSVCMECKRKGLICVTVARGIACLGPVTRAGCGALCPTYDRGCYGCFGPNQTANTPALRRIWRDRLNLSPSEIRHAFRSFNANAEPFRTESEKHVSHEND